MIFLSGFVIRLDKHNLNLKFHEWFLILFGAFIVFLSFIDNFLKIIIQKGFQAYQQVLLNYIPSYYNWSLFFLGEAMFIFTFWLFYRRVKNKTNIR